jgi:Dolichyl-phosphate-mannose-protein mannosyltransferase
MLDVVANGLGGGTPVENTPPLHFVLAWLAVKVGDPTATVHLPSILLGTATVPLAYLLGLRTVGRAGALVGALLLALSPFATFYSIEARAYSTLMFLAVLSVLVLLKATGDGRARWWVAYAACAAALMYTHYVAVLIVGPQALWALWAHRDHWRPLVLAYGAALLVYLPWLPFINSQPADYERLAGLLGVDNWGAFLQWVAGFQTVRPGDLPGTPALVLLAAGLALALVAAAAQRRLRVDERVVLVVLLALATPVALLIYDAVGDNLFVYPRNLSGAYPFLMLAAGWLLTRPPRPIAAVAVLLATAGMTIGAVKALDADYHRPDFRSVGELLDERARPGEVVLYYGAGFDPFIARGVLPLYLDRTHRTAQAGVGQRAVVEAFGVDPAARRAFAVSLLGGAVEGGPPVRGWRELSERVHPGVTPLAVAEYAPLRGDELQVSGDAIRSSDGTQIRVVDKRLEGAVDRSEQTELGLELGGWAMTPDRRPVDLVLAYAGDRLEAVGIPKLARPDLESSSGGVGFALALDPEVAEAGEPVRVFAVSGRVASPLAFYCGPDAKQVIGCP